MFSTRLRRSIFRIFLPLSVVGVLALGVTAIEGSAGASSPPASGSDQLNEAEQAASLPEDLAALPDKIDALGFGTYADTYGGLVGLNLGKQVAVYLTELDPAVEDAFRALAPPDTLTFRQTPHSQAFLKKIQEKLVADSSSLRSSGIQVEEMWPDIDTGMEQIGVTGMTTASTASLENAYGADNVHVFNVAPSEKPIEAVSRIDDTSPFNGGDSIYDYPTTGACSTGFGFYSNDTNMTYQLTAAHCFTSGSEIRNGIFTAGGGINGSHLTMGTVGARDLSDGGIDSEVLRMRGSRLLFTGAIGNPQRVTVSGYTSNPEGYQVCTDGSYDGEICNLTIIKNHDICMARGTGGMACDLVRADNNVAAAAAGEGDSGGPVLRFSGSNLYVTGTISYIGGTQYTCPANALPGRVCAQVVWYTAASSIVQKWNAVVPPPVQ